MSPLHAPGATIAHPGFVNTACKEETAIKVLKFPCRIRGNARVMGVQLARYLDRLVSGIPCSCRAHGGLHLHGPVREERCRSLCLFTFSLLLVSLFVLFFVCLCLKWMTSLCKCGTLVFMARKTELWDGCRWVFLSAEAPLDVLLRVIGIVWHLQLPLTEQWVASRKLEQNGKRNGKILMETYRIFQNLC